jgi:hypothetical protein
MSGLAPFRWRYVVLCGLLWGVVAALTETTTIPLADLPAEYVAMFLLQVAVSRIPSSLVWAAGARIAEDRRHRMPVLLATAVLVWAVSALLTFVWHVLLPATSGGMTGLLMSVPLADLLAYMLWADLFYGGLYVVGYLGARRAGRMRAKLADLRRLRSEADSALRETQLAALRGRLQPELLIEALTVLRQRYVDDRLAGDRLFERLVAFLRAAMPGIRSGRSTLRAELDALGSYVELHAMLDRPTALHLTDLAPASEDVPFSPLALLPLLDSINGALRPGAMLTIGSTRRGDGYHIAIRADGEGSDRLPALAPSFDDAFVAAGARLSIASSARRCDIDIRVPLVAAAQLDVCLVGGEGG